MRAFWAQPLRRQLLAANLLIAIPVLGLAVWEGAATYNQSYQGLTPQASAFAAVTAASVEREVRSFDRLAERLRADPAVTNLDPGAAHSLLAAVVEEHPSILDLVLVDAGGKEVARARPHAAVGAAGNWMAPFLNRRATPVEAAGSAPTDLVVFGHPLEGAGGAVRGALGFYMSLRQASSSSGLPVDSVVVIADRSGRVLAQTVISDGDVAPVFAGSAGELPASGLHTGQDGVSREHALVPVGDGPWSVSVGIPTTLATQGAVGAWWRNATALVVVLLACFLTAWLVSSRVHRSVGDLEAMAQRIAAGDFGPIEPRQMFSPEFAQLQTALDAMLQRFNASRAALDAQMGEERRIRKELESLQTQVIQQERLAAVGQLVSGVAHEINNPLQAILGFAELLQMQSDVPENVKSDLRLIQKESTRACNIIRNLAMFARQQPGEAGPVGMSDVIRAVAELRQRRLETEDIGLVVDDRATQPVKAVLTELQQVLLNFVVNAEQSILAASRLPGRIAIRSYDRDDRVVLEVEDNGPGVPLASEAKLFQPFFTTKPVGQGTGLGLSISYGIIDSLGGAIGHRRVATGGAVFYIELPAAPAAAHAAAPDTVASARSA
jgi:signal transduction histidine kinase